MAEPVNLREALLAEAIGDAARMHQKLEDLAPLLDEKSDRLIQATADLRDAVVAFDARVTAITERAKSQTVQYMAARADDLARRTVAQNSQAMADAARVAFGVELGAAMQRWQGVMQPLIERSARPWEPWLTHAAALSVGALVGWLFAVVKGQV